MIRYSRLTNHPFQKGYIIEQNVRCGKKNCKCFTSSEKHQAFYLVWREFNGKGKLIQRKQYLARRRVADVQKQLSTSKGQLLACYFQVPVDDLEYLQQVTDFIGNRKRLADYYNQMGTCRKALYFSSVR